MGIYQHRKGANFERAVAGILRDIGVVCRRSNQGDGAWQPDLVIDDETLSKIWPELTVGRAPKPFEKMNQAVRDSVREGKGRIPVVVAHKDHGDTLVCLRLEDAMMVLEAYRGGHDGE